MTERHQPERLLAETGMEADEMRALIQPLFVAMCSRGIAKLTITKDGTHARLLIYTDKQAESTP